MEQVKFRTFDKENKHMTYWCSNDVFDNKGGEYCLFWRNIDEEMILMQYTGLKDENGKEIYEGDIIGWEYFCENDKIKEYSIVTFYGGCFCCNDYNRPDFVGREVIGNIYENPELISE